MKRLIPKDKLLAWVLISPMVLWLLALFLGPILVIFVHSFWIEKDAHVIDYFSLDNWVYFLVHPQFGQVLLKSVGIGLAVVATSLAFGYPMAYLVARKIPAKFRASAMTILLFPFLTSHIVRIFGWMTILGRQGFINTALMSLGVIQEPLDFLLYNNMSSVIGLAYVLMPLMIMPCNIVLSRIDPSLMQASYDLGANAFQTFFRVTLPLSKPGIAAGFLLVFVPATGAYFEPLLLGGTRGVMIGNIVANHFTGAITWCKGCALAFEVVFAVALLVAVFLKLAGKVQLEIG